MSQKNYFSFFSLRKWPNWEFSKKIGRNHFFGRALILDFGGPFRPLPGKNFHFFPPGPQSAGIGASFPPGPGIFGRG